MVESGAHVDEAASTLGELSQIDPEDLVSFAMRASGLPLRRGVEIAEQQGLPRGAITPDELAWAIALSLGRGRAEDSVSFQRTEGSGPYSRDYPVSEVLKDLAGGRGSSGSTGYSELAWVVACEKQAVRKRDCVATPAAADKAFEELYKRLHAHLVRYLRSKPSLGDADDLAHDAWLDFSRAYFNADSRSRFRCRSSILTALCGNAVRIGAKQTKRDLLVTGGADDEGGGIIDREPDLARPSEDRIRRLWEGLAHCIEQLGGRLRLIATLRLCQQVPAVKIAADLGVGKPAISNAMKRAKEKIQPCLEVQGIGAEWAESEGMP